MPKLTTLLAFQRGTTRDNFSFVQFQGRDRARAHPDLAAERGVILSCKCLPMVLGLGDDDTVNEYAGYFDLPWIERPAFGNTLHLHDHEPPGILHRHGDGQHFQCECFLLHGDIAVGVGSCAADDADINRKRTVIQELFAIDLDQPDEIVPGAIVYLPAAVARVHKCSKSDAC